jgi:hypothetical protein
MSMQTTLAGVAKMIHFKNMEFLPVKDSLEAKLFIPVNVVFNIGKLPRLINAKGEELAVWRVG